MFRNNFRRSLSTIAVMVLVLFVFGAVSLAQEKQEVDFEKKYADIFGTWEVDLSDAGMGVMSVEFYYESGSIWALPEMSDSPGEMLLVEGEEWKFEIEDEGSLWELEFMKNDKGKYHKCKVVNEAYGVDTVSTKKGDGR